MKTLKANYTEKRVYKLAILIIEQASKLRTQSGSTHKISIEKYISKAQSVLNDFFEAPDHIKLNDDDRSCRIDWHTSLTSWNCSLDELQNYLDIIKSRNRTLNINTMKSKKQYAILKRLSNGWFFAEFDKYNNVVLYDDIKIAEESLKKNSYMNWSVSDVTVSENQIFSSWVKDAVEIKPVTTNLTFQFNIISPDGFSITPEPFESSEATYQDDIKKHFEAWKKRFEHQGYYSSNNGRISLEDLSDFCTTERIKESK